MGPVHGTWRPLPATSEHCVWHSASATHGVVQVCDNYRNGVRAAGRAEGGLRLFVAMFGSDLPIGRAAVLLQDSLGAWDGR
jgi:hypothetical protein